MRRGNWVYHRSSILTSLPALALALALSAVCTLVGLGSAASALMLVFLLGGCARLWGALSLRRVTLSVDSKQEGVFPGQTLQVDLRIRNDKLLPLAWLELYFPLSPDLCMTPEDTRPPEDSERAALEEQGCSTRLVGEKRFSLCLWYETVEVSSIWTAARRGVYSTAGWRLRTGDGLGLSQVERAINPEDARLFAVYPALIPVTVEPFLRNLWNADTGSRGVVEDTTVIRSTRAYQPGDQVKHINWRLAARCQPLSVNIYEDILPRSVHFLLDGESFGGPEPHWEELEEALSILASVLVGLSQAHVACGLSLCQGAGPAAQHSAGEDVFPLLRMLAAYQPTPVPSDNKNTPVPRRVAKFDRQTLLEGRGRVGRFYYIAYDSDTLKDQPVLRELDATCLTLLTWREGQPFGDFSRLGLRSLRKGAAS
ncbi:MAG: DUF58 domain-containing protein [Oscillospiraceae bacterium]|nr:DUF58 domain-containing protein [Oscillospiraceae bacterium]